MNRTLQLLMALTTTSLATGAALAQHHHASGDLESGDIKPGATWETHFDAPTNQTYHCHPHPFMEGRIEVTDAAPNGTVEVHIRDYEFTPSSIQVRPNEMIRFINDGPSVHTVSEGSGSAGTTSPKAGSPGFAVVSLLAILAIVALRAKS